MRMIGYLTLGALFSALQLGTALADRLVVCTEASPDALNAQLSTANTSFDVSEQIADRLVEMKIGGSDLVPGLAESWTISPDGLTYTFKLRHGVKFQSNADFKPTRDFNADDVVFSFHRMSDKSNPFYQSANGNFPEFVDLVAPNLASVDKIDDYTVAFELKSPLAPLLPSLSMQPFSILSAEYAAALQKSGKPGRSTRSRSGRGRSASCSISKDAVIRFRAFPDFWGKAARSLIAWPRWTTWCSPSRPTRRCAMPSCAPTNARSRAIPIRRTWRRCAPIRISRCRKRRSPAPITSGSASTEAVGR